MPILLCMERWRKCWGYLKNKYRLLNEKKYTTIAGTLVFFLLMSLVPMLFWATLLFGEFKMEVRTLGFSGLEEVSALLEYVRKEAENATSGASVFLLMTTLYSATNLFYQMRKSGEIIYGVPYDGGGLKTRLSAVVALFLLLAIIVMAVLAFAVVSFFFSRFFSGGTMAVLRYLLLAVLAFLLALFLNLYICPYRASPKSFLLGSALTVVAWGISILGLTLYLRYGNTDRLYGALNTVIVFLLWLYVLTVCFVAGVIFNSEKVLQGKRLMR